MIKYQAITIPDLPVTLHTQAKAAAAVARQPLKAWIKQAIREKLDRETRGKNSK